MSALEKRTGQSVLKPTPIPRALAEVGVRIGIDESGMTQVVIPPEVSAHLNVLDPVSSFAQADRNWSPSVRVVQLNPDPENGPHFYKQVGNKLAPTKQGLETLASAGGVIHASTSRVRRDELSAGEALGYRATVGIRRSDGQIAYVTREKTFVTDAEYEEIRDAVTRANKFGAVGSPQWGAEVRKRWLKEQKDAPAKTESKAVNRAIRALLQIPHTFSVRDAAKPFMVVGWSFSPDYDDAETKRLLVAAGLTASAEFYGGGRPVSREIEAPATPHDPGPDDEPDEPDASTAGTADDGAGQQAGAAVLPPDAAAPVPDEDAALEAEFAEQFPIPASASTEEVAALKAAADEGGKYVFEKGMHGGKTLFQVAAAADGEKRVKYLLKRPGTKAHEAALAFARVYLPEVLAAVEQEAQAAKDVAA